MSRSKNPQQITEALERILPDVQRPGRYVGGEHNSISKEWLPQRLKVALAFPDIYDLGMPNLGLAIFYDLLNQRDDILAERVFMPWLDMEQLMVREGVPLYSLETRHPVVEFDVLGITLPYEQLYTNVLHMMHLSGIPLRSSERFDGEYPLIVAGGHATYNPEPMAEFIDVFLIGEGEDAILEIAEVVKEWQGAEGAVNGDAAREGRRTLLRKVAVLDGVYVPQFYSAEYNDDGTLAKVRANDQAAHFPVLKRIVKQLPAPTTKFVVPYVDVVHNRAAIEIMRGCTRGCRFCHAGMVTRPVRERTVSEILEAVGAIIESTGYEEIALLSLSSSDYTHVASLVDAISAEFGPLNLNISLPSLRIETVSVDLMDRLKAAGRRGGFTLAPEAASERMREIINKPVSTEQLLTTARAIYARGWQTIKLYFMVGHPSETLDDVRDIADLAKKVIAEGRKELGARARLNVGVSTFVPKPHTPFQWSPCDTLQSIEMKHSLLRSEVRGKGLKLSLNNPRETMMEAWLSRGDRRMGAVIYEAYRRGARFDAWREHFNIKSWEDAFRAEGIDAAFYNDRVRDADEVFPWDHIDVAIKKSFLFEDYEWSIRGEIRDDCRNACYACGILPKFIPLRKETAAEDWECPEVKPRHLRGKQIMLHDKKVPDLMVEGR